jgi:hypothetical protein
MKRKIVLGICLFSFISASAQEKCGTMQMLNENMQNDPALKLKMDKLEIETQNWIKSNRKTKYEHNSEKQTTKVNAKSLCGNVNTYFTTIAAPTTQNNTVTANPNCIYGGEYVTVTGLVAGNIYRISTCGVDNFDTQLTIYETVTGTAVAYNDDYCGTQSTVNFNPIYSGSYDVLVNEYNCQVNELCASLEIELIYTPREVITIPVVVHIVHNGENIGSGTNITNSQVLSQIDVLNEDFRRFNSDINLTPAAMRGLSDDPLIEFCLAQQDEFGNATSGIIRYNGQQASWVSSEIENTLKPSTIWDRDEFLNIWVLEFGGDDSNTLGYAQFPGGNLSTDGVVVSNRAFGTIGALSPTFNKGRTTTHEIGHWLNLRHIWGDEAGCVQDDLVQDTPLQDWKSGGVPIFPMLDDCSPNYPGNMFQNYMDYSDDIALTAFTIGQTERMDAALFSQRASLLSSNGCVPPINSIEESMNNISIAPNPSSGVFNIYFDSKHEFNVSIYDMSGKEILTSKVFSSINNLIDLSKYKKGIYYLKMSNEYETLNKKIILTN